jgi:hypothetical protein
LLHPTAVIEACHMTRKESESNTLNSNNNSNISSKWELIKNGVPKAQFLGLCFSYYINELPKIIPKYNSTSCTLPRVAVAQSG